LKPQCIRAAKPWLRPHKEEEEEELELWIARGSWLHMVEGRYNVTAWSRFYTFSIYYSAGKSFSTAF
jgi:hypothetical protein